jgi:hypothetical protein
LKLTFWCCERPKRKNQPLVTANDQVTGAALISPWRAIRSFLVPAANNRFAPEDKGKFERGFQTSGNRVLVQNDYMQVHFERQYGAVATRI